jgi:Tol biopolymer transport system component
MAPPAAPPAPAVAPAAERRVPIATLVSVGVAGLLAVAAVVWSGAASRTRAPASTPNIVPLTGNSGVETIPAFSPDGRQLAYAWDGGTGGSLDIYVKLIGAGAPLRLTTGETDEVSPTWSPDGGQIAFLRRTMDGTGVFVVPALGGPERKLGHTSAKWFPGRAWYAKLAWSPDGRFLAMVDRESPTGTDSIFLLTIESGEKRRLTSPPPHSLGDASPAFSPDGRMLAFERAAGNLVSDIYLQGVSAGGASLGEPTQLTFDRRGIFALDWTPDGREIVFSSNAQGRTAYGASPQPVAFRNRWCPVAKTRSGPPSPARDVVRPTCAHTLT